MSPIYQDGDYVLVQKMFFRSSLRPGDTIAFRHGVYGVMLKRIERLEPDSGLVYVIGENAAFSTDSRDFGPIHQSDMIGKVIFNWRKPRS